MKTTKNKEAPLNEEWNKEEEEEEDEGEVRKRMKHQLLSSSSASKIGNKLLDAEFRNEWHHKRISQQLDSDGTHEVLFPSQRIETKITRGDDGTIDEYGNDLTKHEEENDMDYVLQYLRAFMERERRADKASYSRRRRNRQKQKKEKGDNDMKDEKG